MKMYKYLCSHYGSRKCPMYGTCGVIYDICPQCEEKIDNLKEETLQAVSRTEVDHASV